MSPDKAAAGTIWPSEESGDPRGKVSESQRSFWFRYCCPSRVEVTPALLLVRFGWSPRLEDRPVPDDRVWQEVRQELRKLGRGVAQSAIESGLQRPVVLAIEESNEDRRRMLDKLAADQEWHRGDFALWPLKPTDQEHQESKNGKLSMVRSFDWLLQPTVQALSYNRQTKTPSDEQTSGQSNEAIVEDLSRKSKTPSDEQTSGQSDKAIVEGLSRKLKTRSDEAKLKARKREALAMLLEQLFAEIVRRRAPTESKTFDDSEMVALDGIASQWLRSEVHHREEELKPSLGRSSPAWGPFVDGPRAQSEATPSLTVRSYGAIEVRGVDELHFSADDDEEARKSWAERYRDALVRLREQTRWRPVPVLAVDAQCTPAVAMFIGSWFHAATRIRLRAVQHNQGTGETETWERTPGRIIDAYELQVQERVTGEDPDELQVRISITRDVSVDADAWTKARGDAVAILDLRVAEPSSGVVKNGDDAFAIARAARERIITAQRTRGHRLPLRIFFAGPNALALFVGAELNAMGRVFLMDFDKNRGQYVVSFDYAPGN